MLFPKLHDIILIGYCKSVDYRERLKPKTKVNKIHKDHRIFMLRGVDLL